MADTEGEVAGYLGAFVAALFFGSNYVVCKKFPIGDGFAFQWFMSLGILIVGYINVPLGTEPYFNYWGLLGGSLWAAGNVMVPYIIRFIGIGLGLLLWSTGNLVIGWSVGEFGLFGIEPTTLVTPWLNIVGVCLALVAMFFYFFVEPTIEDPPEEVSDVYKEIVGGDEDPFEDKLSKSSINAAYFVDDPPTNAQEHVLFFMRKHYKRLLGTSMALATGCLYGINLVPFQRWFQKNPGSKPLSPLTYSLSQFSGIFLFATIVMGVYVIFKRNNPIIYPQSIAPAIVSGAMWAVATSGWMVANAQLGMSVGYPIVVVGPMIVSSLWAVIVFREIRGAKNLACLGVALMFNIASVTCVALSAINL